MAEVAFSLAGLGVAVSSEQETFLDRLRFDFDAFEQPCQKFLELSVGLGPTQLPPNLKESFRGPYGVCFDEGPVRHILYPGPVAVQFDFDQERGHVQGPNADLVYERLYLTILSRLGEALEHRGRHRVHALGVDTPRGGALFLFPERMGKSTLAAALLRRPGWRLFSEDTPMVDRAGFLHSLPFRLGLRDPLQADVFPEEMVSRAYNKQLLKAAAFEIQRHPQKCRSLFVGAWTTGPQAIIEPISRLRTVPALARDLVVGVGVPQVAELFLRPGLVQIASKAAIAARRLQLLVRLAAQCQSYRLHLAPDPAQNVERLERWAQSGE